MKKSTYTLYMLVDPRDHKPFYIGQSGNVNLRYHKDHLNPEPSDKSDRATKIREILVRRQKPILVILERTTRKVSALMREMFWIELFQSRGIRLKNQENQRWLLKQYDDLMEQARTHPQ